MITVEFVYKKTGLPIPGTPKTLSLRPEVGEYIDFNGVGGRIDKIVHKARKVPTFSEVTEPGTKTPWDKEPAEKHYIQNYLEVHIGQQSKPSPINEG